MARAMTYIRIYIYIMALSLSLSLFSLQQAGHFILWASLALGASVTLGIMSYE